MGGKTDGGIERQVWRRRGESAVHDDRKKGYFTFHILKLTFIKFSLK